METRPWSTVSFDVEKCFTSWRRCRLMKPLLTGSDVAVGNAERIVRDTRSCPRKKA